MMRVHRRVSAAYGDCLLVLLQAEESHVARNRRIYRQKRVTRAKSLRLLQRLQPALRLAAARIGISQSRMTKGKIGIQLERFGYVHHGRFGAPSPRIA